MRFLPSPHNHRHDLGATPSIISCHSHPVPCLSFLPMIAVLFVRLQYHLPPPPFPLLRNTDRSVTPSPKPSQHLLFSLSWASPTLPPDTTLSLFSMTHLPLGFPPSFIGGRVNCLKNNFFLEIKTELNQMHPDVFPSPP